jgi:Carboxypeptidase regulatory-like domain
MLSRSLGIVPVCLLAFGGLAAAQSTDAKIAGVVADQKSGKPLDGTTIEVRSKGSLVADGCSRQDGSFSLPAVPPGVYELLAIRDGYYPLNHPLELKPRDALRITLSLVPVESV